MFHIVLVVGGVHCVNSRLSARDVWVAVSEVLSLGRGRRALGPGYKGHVAGSLSPSRVSKHHALTT